MRIGSIRLGDGAPLALISGLNVLEGESDAVEIARAIKEIAQRHELPLVFKASFDKANRSSFRSFRGPGLDEGLGVLARVKAETALPVTTDVHEPWQSEYLCNDDADDGADETAQQRRERSARRAASDLLADDPGDQRYGERQHQAEDGLHDGERERYQQQGDDQEDRDGHSGSLAG